MPSHRKPTLLRHRLLAPALTVLLTVSGVSFAVHGAQEATRSSDEPQMATSSAPGTAEDTDERMSRPSRSARSSRPAVPRQGREARDRRPRQTATPTPTRTPSTSPTKATPTPTKVRSPEVAAPTKPSPTTTAGGEVGTAGTGSPILRATNTARTNAGLRPLVVNACLTKMAQQHAERLAASRTLYHQDLGAVASACGTSTTGENVAMNHTGPSAMVGQWLDSPGHRANLLNGDFALLGIGTARGGDGAWYGVQLFGAK